jgi:hypothetical protein
VPAWGSLLRDVAAQIGGALLNASGRHVPTPAPRIQQTPIVTPPAPGFAPLSQTPRNQTNAREYAQAYDALFGRVSSRLGPTNPRWTTFSGELKPEVITSAIEQANAGLPFQFCDMLRRAVENDAHLAGCVLQAFAAIVAKPDSIDPPASLVRDPVAQSVAHWLRAVREQVADFDAARFALLWAEATRFAGAENIFGWRKVTWYRADGKRISRQYLVPVKLEIVEARAFRFDVETDEPLLWLQGDYIPLPAGKFIFHVAHGISQIRERGGFGRAVLFLHAIKQWAIRDAALYLHLYGLNQGIISYDQKVYEYPEFKQNVQRVIEAIGQGAIPQVPADLFKLDFVAPSAQNALVHTQFGDWLNGEITKAVTAGGPLQMSTTGGSQGLGDVHADGAYSTQLLRAQNLCDSIRRDTWSPTLQLNQYRLLSDLADLPGIGVTPDDIVAALPAYTPQIDRVSDPEKRQKILSQAMLDGCSVSVTQYRAVLQIDAPRDEADTLKGAGIPIPSSGAVVSAVDASGGVLAPSPNAETPTTAPVLHSLNPEAPLEQPATVAVPQPTGSTNPALTKPKAEESAASRTPRRRRAPPQRNAPQEK